MTAPPWEDPRKVLTRHGLQPKRRFSQNFLVAPHVVETIADAVVAGAPSQVLELGPGVGTLTAALLRRGVSVVALERDRQMIAVLEEELAGCDVRIVEGDAASIVPRAHLPPPVTLTGNLPYAITGAILRRVTEERESLARVVVMVQREVRDRLLATPETKDYGALSVFVQASYDVSTVCLVKRGSFHPPPRVDSAVVSLVPSATARAELTPAFEAVVRAAFQQRRKTLRNALKPLGDPAREALAACGIDPKRRGETLPVERFAELARAYAALL